MISLFIISLILYSLTDWLRDYAGWRKELAKLGWIGILACFVLIDWNIDLILAWIFLHYPIHQISQGLLRMGKWNYLGSGWFDKAIGYVIGNTWAYASSLLFSLIVGILLILQIRS